MTFRTVTSESKSISSLNSLKYVFLYSTQNEISKIKKLLEDFASQFKDPTSKNKLKEMWKNASR
jgi:hypothetical protein